MTAIATVKLPRLLLFALAFGYIVAGLLGRDPWKTDDVVGLATMLSALRGEGGWLTTHIGSLALAQDGPLAMWFGGALISVFGSLVGDVIASRLANLVWFAVTLSSLWYGTYLLGRRTEAQPLALPFGGEPSVKDYGRLLADAAMLLMLATVGILARLHETSIVPAHIACHALAFFALARMLDKPLMGAGLLAFAISGAFLSRAWPGLLPVLFAVLFALHPRSGLWSKRHHVLTALLLAGAVIATWWTLATRADPDWIEAWRHWNTTRLGLPEFEVAMRPLRDLPWFLWPIWPLAMLALWQWRRWLTAPHIWLPVAFVLGVLLTLPILQEPGEPEYVLFVMPLAALAAFALPTMRRGVINTLDWFALMCFSVTIACVWIGWLALHFNIPKQISINIARQTVGYEPRLLWWPVVAAALVTLCWIALVIWRLRFRPTVLWRGSMLCAAGLTLTWLLLVLLWLPALDYVRSYRPMSAQVKQALAQAATQAGQPACLRAQGLSLGPRASLYVFEGITFTYDSRCPFVLQQTTLKQLEEGSTGYSDVAIVLWQGSRGADRYDRYRLLRIPNQ